MNRRLAKFLLPILGLAAAALLLFLARSAVLGPDPVDDGENARPRDPKRSGTTASHTADTDAREETGPGGVLLRFRVNDAGGAPVPRALVTARVVRGRSTWEEEVLTDPEGVAEIPGAPGDTPVVCAVRRDATALGVRVRRRTPATGTLECSVVLDDGPERISGILTGEGGSPAFVVGQVEISKNGLTVPTDDRGHFEITGLAVGARVTLLARASGFVPMFVTAFVTAQAGDTISIALRRGATLTGRVVDADGEPVTGARIRCSSSAHQAGAYRSFVQNGVSGPDGRFELGGVRTDVPARLAVEAGTAGKAVISVPADRIAAGSEGDVGDVTVRGGYSVVGVVIDDAESPVVDASIHVLEQRDGADCVSEWSRSDREGRFSICDLPAARYRVRASEGAVEAKEEIELRESDPVGRVRLVLRLAGTVRVVVTDDRGRPVRGLRVSVEIPARSTSVYAWTDERGVARLAVEKESARHLSISGEDDAGRPVIPIVLRTPVRSEETRVTVRFGARARGRVVDDDGRPAAGAHVVALVGGSLLARAVADETGAFSIVIDPTARTTVALDGIRRVTTPSGGYYDEDAGWTGRMTDAWAGTPMELIARPRGRARHELAVTLLDAAGSPVSGVTLLGETRMGSTPASITDTEGRAVLVVQGSGLHRLRTRSADSEEAFVVDVAANVKAVWRLPEDRAIIGRVPPLEEGETGHAVLSLGGRSIARAEIEPSGSFVLIAIEPVREWADLVVTRGVPGGRPVEVRRKVILPSDARVEFRVR